MYIVYRPSNDETKKRRKRRHHTRYQVNLQFTGKLNGFNLTHQSVVYYERRREYKEKKKENEIKYIKVNSHISFIVLLSVFILDFVDLLFVINGTIPLHKLYYVLLCVCVYCDLMKS